MKIKESEKKILENYFKIFESEDYYELESWSDGGVDMIIYLEKDGSTLLEQLKDYVGNFDIDYEIDLYREIKTYRDKFTITESVEDFKDYINYVKKAIDELEHEHKKYTYEDFSDYTLEESLEILKREITKRGINADNLILDIEEELKVQDESVAKCGRLIQEVVNKINEEE